MQFEKGELLVGPIHPLESFCFVVEGSVSIYLLTEDGDIRYVSKSGEGILLGDMEFSGIGKNVYYVEAATPVVCLGIPFRENMDMLGQDPLFLRFVIRQLAQKLSLSSRMDAVAQTLEEKVLLYLHTMQASHEISSVSQTLQVLHCSRRQLQRVLRKLCDSHVHRTGFLPVAIMRFHPAQSVLGPEKVSRASCRPA
ncbi:MAG: Crp/Fnr family transcriptional regulator [Sphaerochaetaceae bacterium]|nr:Crp/Fnr family transcriptional regulator [Spirochaetales bacterium]MDY5499940.1 Crp/Fnr family transcriptional regulator [Sphaerochaetaceae bacterium]